MKQLNLAFIFLFLISNGDLFTQTKEVKAEISTRKRAELSIIRVYPDSFPTISAIFKAETKTGEPVWNLQREDMQVNENESECEVISLRQISKFEPIQIAIVLDHSSSMLESGHNSAPWKKRRQITPIKDAKKAITSFARSFNFEKDQIAIVGFSDSVAEILPLGKDLKVIEKTISGMQAGGHTALLDGISVGTDLLAGQKGIRILVVMTDGMDNSSKHYESEVISKAQREEVTIYTIGLGDALKGPLKSIATSSGGAYYHTKASKNLASIYAKISRSVQAYYEIIYVSKNLESSNDLRNVNITFDVDSIDLESKMAAYVLPKDVKSLLRQREIEEEKRIKTWQIVGGGTAGLLLLGVGALFFYYQRKRKSKPQILKVFPNPARNQVQIDHDAKQGELHLLNTKGKILLKVPIAGTSETLDISRLKSGTYLLFLVENGDRSRASKLLIQR